VDIDYFAGQLQTVLELENVDPTQLSILLTKDIVLYEGGNIFNCCVIGFHSAGPVLGVVGNPAQTFAWASWLSPADDFGGGFEDILPLSHEIGEWANDPYTNNIVPAWQEPDGSGNCGGNLLEVGDPVEIFPSPSFPTLVDGYVYHPQTLALLQWFSRETPSSAIDQGKSVPKSRPKGVDNGCQVKIPEPPKDVITEGETQKDRRTRPMVEPGGVHRWACR